MTNQRIYIVCLSLFVLGTLGSLFSTMACGGKSVTIPSPTPDPNATPSPVPSPTPTPLPSPTPTPDPNATPSPTPTPTPAPTPTPNPVRRATPVPGPSPAPWVSVQAPLALTNADVTGAWVSNVYGPTGGHRYIMVLTNIASAGYAKLSWEQARTAASQKQFGGKNGHLVAINSLDEQRSLMSTFDHAVGTGGQSAASVLADQKNPVRGLAIGAKKTNNVWQWITGENFPFTDGYAYWTTLSEPSGDGNYIQFYTESLDADTTQKSRYGWNDYDGDSSETFGYIVEFE